MSMPHDPEFEDLFADPGLAEFANALRSVEQPDAPLDPAFRSALRRQLMQKAWEMSEGRIPWWRRLASPPGLAWAGAAAGMALIASVVVFMSTQGPAVQTEQVLFTSSVADARGVQLQQPIPLTFNQAMDHPSTEAAVQVQPATKVTYTWQGNTLLVQPQGGNLAPNTQYQVTVGPSAKMAGGQTIAAPETVRFVTQPAPSPAPSPSPTPGTLVTNVTKIFPLNGQSVRETMWSPDASTIYLAPSGGTLEAIDVKTGAAKVLVTDGVTSAALSPTGDRIAYVRGGKIEILTLATSTTSELAVKPEPVVVSWVTGKVADQLLWATQDGVYDQDAKGTAERLAAFPGAVTGAISIAPDGRHVVYLGSEAPNSGGVFVLDVATGKALPVGIPFPAWSPDGSRFVYQSDNGSGGVVIADLDGNEVATLPAGMPSWSVQNEILLGSETELDEVRPDGTGQLKLADGTFAAPVWAQDSISFAFQRGGSLWVAQAPAPGAPPAALDQATALVKAFMQARLNGSNDSASKYLDAAGQASFRKDGAALIPSGNSTFSRFYILTSEVLSADSNSTRFVVRLVFDKNKVDVSQLDETLTVTRRESTDPFLVHAVEVGNVRPLGQGPEVVSVDITSSSLVVTFDSDLNPATVPLSVTVRDSHGKPLTGVVTTYANHKATISGLQLIPGDKYTLTVLPTLRDVSDRAVVSEYDLVVIGPQSTPTTSEPAPTSPTPTATP